MRRVAAAAVAAVCLLSLGLAMSPALGAGPVQGSADGVGVSVTLDRDRAEAGPGDKLAFVSTVTNDGSSPRSDLIAHLNILTTDADVYVDPEDWSPRRTQYLDELAPGESADLDWDVQAVTSGPLILFVSVTSTGGDNVTSSGPLHLTVGGQRNVNSAGVATMALWPPAVVLLLLGGTLVRRRRHR